MTRRWFRSGLLAVLLALGWLSSGSFTAHAQGENGLVTPAAGSTVSGVVDVAGIATHPAFRKWQLDILIGGDEHRAHFLALGEKPAGNASQLFQLNSGGYPNGNHKLRLRVVHSNLNYDEYFTPFVISNRGGAQAPSVLLDDAGREPAAAPKAVTFRTDAPADGKRWIEIDISDQSLTAYQGDVPVFQTIVSTGKPGWRTLPGTFKVYVKYEKTRMTGPDYDTPDVPWTMYYYRGFAIHGAYWHNKFGTPVSHGCVNLRVPEAKALFEWSDVGTEVVVRE